MVSYLCYLGRPCGELLEKTIGKVLNSHLVRAKSGHLLIFEAHVGEGNYRISGWNCGYFGVT
jgi:hypothetical protein